MIPEKFVELLRYNINREKEYPKDLYRSIRAMDVAARLLIENIPNLQIRALLLEERDRFENENETWHGLGDIADCTGRLLTRLGDKRNRSKLYPDGARLDAKGLCAFIVSIAWWLETDKWPGRKNRRVQQMCEDLWAKASGSSRPRRNTGEPQPSRPDICPAKNWGRLGSESVAAWKHHLDACHKVSRKDPQFRLVIQIFSGDVEKAPALEQALLRELIDEKKD
jgi:hypothetical protein